MLRKINNPYFARPVSLFLIVQMVCYLFLPTGSYALTSGPSQPETQGFTPSGMDNMVDPFTGDFSYNIPLMDVGGYPLTLNYSAGITPDQEASWVGLGWNLSVGAINRNVRGLPDDFKGEQVKTELNMKPNQTVGVSFPLGAIDKLEFWGFPAKIGGNLNLFYNNYNGFGFALGVNSSVDVPLSSKNEKKAKGDSLNLGLNLSLGSEDGVGVSPSFGISRKKKDINENAIKQKNAGFSLSFPYNSRDGAKGVQLSASFERKRVEHKKFVKNKQGDLSFGQFVGFAAPAYQPLGKSNSYSVAFSLDLSKYSFTNEGVETSISPSKISGYFNGQFLESVDSYRPSYGYMYMDGGDANHQLDFNREKETGSFNQYTKNMALANATYDIYNVSGNGIGGTYRLQREGAIRVFDPEVVEKSYSIDLGLGFGFGTTPSNKIDVDANVSVASELNTRWEEAKIPFLQGVNEISNDLRERAYFTRVGEMAPNLDTTQIKQVYRNDDAVALEIISNDGDLSGNLIAASGRNTGLSATSDNNTRKFRQARTSSFDYLTAEEADKHALLPIETYELNKFSIVGSISQNPNDPGNLIARRERVIKYPHTELNRVDIYKQPHHISEIKVTDNGGSRYVYGVPVYNYKQEEATFSIQKGNESNFLSGKIAYSPLDASTNNSNGLDNYYTKQITPAYASSYLLTSVLSSDYVDSDNVRGPSDGDLGNYTKINYTKTSSSFKWRTPYEKDLATYNPMLNSKYDDDKASVSYGEKELWYVHSIETRTHVAEFYISKRLDGIGVIDDRGGVADTTSNENTLFKLDKIVLYAKTDKLNGKNEPLKTVHFKYSYSLCGNTPNSIANTSDSKGGNVSKGKLTLEKVWFTYGMSGKGVLNPYKFVYADADFDGTTDAELNPEYNSRNYDRWGNFKLNSATLRNDVFPYLDQDNASVADANARVYSLSSIHTPTGGTIRVHLEADDYAYVQDRRAMRMFKILGFSSQQNPQSGDFLLRNSLMYLPGNQKRYMHIDLGEGIKNDNEDFAKKIFEKEYISNVDNLYYKVKANVLSLYESEPRWDYVSGYCKFNRFNFKLYKNNSDNYNVVILELDPDKINGIEANPIVKNCWLHAKMNLNREMKGLGNANSPSVLSVVRAIFSVIPSIKSFFFGFGTYMAARLNANQIQEGESFVRLNEPNKMKKGGGHRVKAIVMSDNFDTMKSKLELAEDLKEVSFYGQKYDYTKEDTIVLSNQASGIIKRKISSGVAAYEPMMGNEENPFRQPVYTRNKKVLAPDDIFMLEEPFGESFFPAPSVGYSAVKTTPVKIVSKNYNVAQLAGNGTGYVMQEFYTAKDFPTITEKTILHYRQRPQNRALRLIWKYTNRTIATATQGYTILTNDMHGKEKSKMVMPDPSQSDPNPKPISFIKYYYKTDSKGRVDGSVDFIRPEEGFKIVKKKTIVQLGKSHDIVYDTDWYKSTTIGGGIQFNMKGIYPVIPIIAVMVMPSFTYDATDFKSVVCTKVVNQHGILEKTVGFDNGKTVTTHNLAWDEKTGEVLLTKIENEFNDPIWNFTIPSYWYYAKMGLAAVNSGAVFNKFDATVASKLQDGDEIIAENSTNSYYLYFDKSRNSLVTKSGETVNNNFTKLKVVRSGNRNMPTVPIGSISCMADPMAAGGFLQFNKVLNASASEFKEDWKAFCNCLNQDINIEESNPFVLGKRGNFRPWRSWTYLTERVQTRTNDNLNIRKDGVFKDFISFWHFYNQNLMPANQVVNSEAAKKWQFVTQIENYNQVGMEIENKDALQRYSMAQFGYGRNLPTATSNNSRYSETGFDGFEDYEYGDCNDDHFSWRSTSNVIIDKTESHTGKSSIRVAPKNSATITKTISPCND